MTLTFCLFMREKGRVHLATVKSVDAVKSTAMVEWHERNICRGKEVRKSIHTERTVVTFSDNNMNSNNHLLIVHNESLLKYHK